MRIVHFSDWHGQSFDLPEADLYICTGDMYPDPYGYRTAQTMLYQQEWFPDLDKRFASKAPIVCVKGNHDCWDLAQLFSRPVIEMGSASHPETCYVGIEQVRIGVLTGVRAYSSSRGGWDKTQDARLAERVQYLPKNNLDILIAHTPALGLLDFDGVRNYGVEALRMYLFDHPPKLFCHGHVHEDAGEPVHWRNVLISNAATRFNVIDLEGF
jgi:Icc-related predicted phosphoesterase